MDPFTQKLLQRTQARQENLMMKMAKTPQPLPRKRRSPLQEENIASIMTHMNEIYNSDTSSCSSEQVSVSDSKENCTAEDETVSNLEPLSKKLCDQNETDKLPSVHGRTARLAALAANINNWEDEINSSAFVSSKSTKCAREAGKILSDFANKETAAVVNSNQQVEKSKAPLSQISESQKHNLNLHESVARKDVCISPEKFQRFLTSNEKKQNTKTVVWDKAVIATLEAQGFVQSPSKSKLQYDYKKADNAKKNVNEEDASDDSSDKVECAPASSSSSSVKDLAKRFEAPIQMKNTADNFKDPSILSLSERVALFEKRKLDFPQVKPNVQPNMGSVVSAGKATVQQNRQTDSSLSPQHQQLTSPTKVGQHTLEIQKQLLKHAESGWKGNEIFNKLQKERQDGLDLANNRWTRKQGVDEVNLSNVETGTKGNSVPGAEVVQSVLDSGKAINLSHSFSSETSCDDISIEASDTDRSHGVGVIPEPPPLPDTSYKSPGTEKLKPCIKLPDKSDSEEEIDINDVQMACSEIDDLSSDEEMKEELTPETTSTELSDKHTDYDSSILQAAFQSTQSSALPSRPFQNKLAYPAYESESEHYEEYNAKLPLMHTVSFYRRQKEVKRTVIKVGKGDSPKKTLPETDKEKHLNDYWSSNRDKLKELQEEADAQLIIMSQASQALNLCRSTSEFYGSAEQIEGERLLLISSHRRQSCLNEIQRLKTDSALEGPRGLQMFSKGSLTLGEIKLPLKQEFLAQTNSGKLGEFVHYFVCLVKHRGQVIATQMMSTLDGLSAGAFHFPNLINVHDLNHDFNVLFEVYGLQTKRDNINKSKKTLGNRKDKSKLTLTPKKQLLKQESKLISPGIQSPGGPSAICTSSFSLIGFTMINIKTVKKTHWLLEKVPFVSPLEGNIYMKVQCHSDNFTEEEGFLTMFEDVSGLGAWYRRWFQLSRRHLSYWKYPDDAKRKQPIGQIDLCQCVTSVVSLVPRDICARPNTLMLVILRPASSDDTETLVSQSYNNYMTTKVLLSADTKEDRIIWCQHLNDALGSLRAWDPDALQPIPFN